MNRFLYPPNNLVKVSHINYEIKVKVTTHSLLSAELYHTKDWPRNR